MNFLRALSWPIFFCSVAFLIAITFVEAQPVRGPTRETITGDGAVGDVSGPASSTDEAICRYDGTTGKLLQNSTVTLGDAGEFKVGGITSFTVVGTSTQFGNPLIMNANNNLAFAMNTINDAIFDSDTTADQLVLQIGPNFGRQLILGDDITLNTDYGHADTGNFVLYIQNSSTVFASQTHNGTDFAITSSSGNTLLDPAVKMPEQASVSAVTAGFGIVYVKNTVPSTLVFKDDTDVEITLGTVSALVSRHANDALHPSSAPCGASSRNAHAILTFDDGVDVASENCVFEGVMPDDYSGGTITITVVYALETATTGTVEWNGQWERIDDAGLDIDADSFAAIQTTGAITVPGTSGVTDYATMTFTQAQADGIAASEAFRFKLIRDTPGDRAADDAQMLRWFATQ